ncbi:3-ketoacyl-ACP reductase [Shouchella lehensis]|uniref:3-ketoacyl-ACP reductase n=1 Tax=Shouchella lehensis TaxID=300825 RepID=A0A4Y7WEZ7_9BACI|nr:3-ketoacyl-ACP reductase [Shouchella lehensis]MBG9784945.1 3-ketoacyl-ACP reductase [Shouchella lehensis]TES46364.1 3-ketoacyl-ACP reductase [Shouchella lehensis]
MQSIKGKVALITGAGRGIGRSTAIAFAKEGIHVGLVGRTVENLQNVADELKEYDVNVAIAAASIEELDSITKAVEQVRAELGPIDILVNNAGISKFGGFMDLTPEDWTNIIDVNVKGVYYTTRAVLPEMVERQTGDIIMIASTAGQKGAPATSAYTASKAAVIGLSESLMMEVRKQNIRVTTLTPSTVATDMAKELQLTDGNPESVMQPEDMADLMMAQLKLHPRVVLKHAGLWSNNP